MTQNSTNTVWLVYEKPNPHVWATSNETLIAVFPCSTSAILFMEKFPDKKYNGTKEPRRILEMMEVEIGVPNAMWMEFNMPKVKK